MEIAPTGTRMFLPDGTIVPVDTSTGVTRCMHVKFGNGKDPKFGALRDTMNGKHVTFATDTDMTASRDKLSVVHVPAKAANLAEKILGSSAEADEQRFTVWTKRMCGVSPEAL